MDTKQTLAGVLAALYNEAWKKYTWKHVHLICNR